MRQAARNVTNAVTDAASHLGIDLADYDAKIRTFIPGYETMIETASFALQVTMRRRRPVIVDLGIGTGALSHSCRGRIPGARIIGVDGDHAMLAAARARIGSSLKTIHGNFEDVELPPCDAMVAALAIHHVPTVARRLRLFRRIHATLPPGGVLINADCFPESDPRLAAADRALWFRHLEESYSPSEARHYMRAWSREDFYVPLTQELDLLRKVGFTVDVPSRRGTFAVIVAGKSRRRSGGQETRRYSGSSVGRSQAGGRI
jgi:trans-aconitate methyltransferase